MAEIEYYSDQRVTPAAQEVLAFAVREVYGDEKVKFRRVPNLTEGVLSFGKRGKGVYTLSPKQMLVVPNAVSVLTQSLKVHRDGYPLPEFNYQVVSDPAEVIINLPDMLANTYVFQHPVSLDAEWDKDGNILCLSMYYRTTNMVTVFSEEIFKDEAAAKALLEFVYGHYYTIWANGKADQVAIELATGIRVPNWFDTMLAHHSLHPSASGQHGLKDMAQRYFGIEDWDKEIYKHAGRGDDADYGRVPRHLLYLYNGYDSFYTFWLYDYFLPLVENHPAFWTEVEWANAFVDVEVFGARVDLDAVQDLKDNLEEQAKPLLARLQDEFGLANPNSPQQVKKVLAAQGLNLPSTDAKHLEKHKTEPFVATLLAYRGLTKQITTYCNSYLRKADQHGILHQTYNVHGTGSGRMSGSNPNLTNVPRDTKLRNLFVPREGHVLVSTDLAQAELRVQAVESGDPDLIAAFQPGAGDFFDLLMPNAFPEKFSSVVAFKEFKKENGEEGKNDRAKLKGTIYGLNFGRGAAAIAEALEMPTEEAQAIIDNFFNAYPVWVEWRKKVEHAAVTLEDRDFLTTALGLTFDAEVITKRNYAGTQRSALSFLPQGNVAFIAVTAMCRIIKALKRDYPEAHVINFIHDDILTDCPAHQAEEIGLLQQQIIEDTGRWAFGDVVFFKAEPNSAGRWGEIL